MKRTLLLLALIILVNVCVAQTNQSHSFNISRLSEAGKNAYRTLFEAEQFSLGGMIAREETALLTLLAEMAAVEALMSLVEEAGPEAGLYALLGLRQIDPEAFNRAAEKFRLKEEPPFRIILDGLKVRGGIVATSIPNGCIGNWEDKLEVINAIESGKYDEYLKRVPEE